MNLLKMDNEVQAQPHPAVTEIPEFKSVIEEFDNAQVMLAYIYLKNDPKSPYRNYDEELKKEKVKEDLFDDEEYEVPETVKKAEEKFIELSTTPEQRMLQKATNSIFSLMDYLDEFDPTETDKNGKLKWSTKDYIRNMEKLPSVVETLRDLREKVDEGEETAGDIRGGVELTKWNK